MSPQMSIPPHWASDQSSTLPEGEVREPPQALRIGGTWTTCTLPSRHPGRSDDFGPHRRWPRSSANLGRVAILARPDLAQIVGGRASA